VNIRSIELSGIFFDCSKKSPCRSSSPFCFPPVNEMGETSFNNAFLFSNLLILLKASFIVNWPFLAFSFRSSSALCNIVSTFLTVSCDLPAKFSYPLIDSFSTTIVLLYGGVHLMFLALLICSFLSTYHCFV
jgi:hypothetical protein